MAFKDIIENDSNNIELEIKEILTNHMPAWDWFYNSFIPSYYKTLIPGEEPQLSYETKEVGYINDNDNLITEIKTFLKIKVLGDIVIDNLGENFLNNDYQITSIECNDFRIKKEGFFEQISKQATYTYEKEDYHGKTFYKENSVFFGTGLLFNMTILCNNFYLPEFHTASAYRRVYKKDSTLNELSMPLLNPSTKIILPSSSFWS